MELLFPELYPKINWEIKSEALDNELLEIQKEIFSKSEAEKIISDKIIKVRMKDNESKILFIHFLMWKRTLSFIILEQWM